MAKTKVQVIGAGIVIACAVIGGTRYYLNQSSSPSFPSGAELSQSADVISGSDSDPSAMNPSDNPEAQVIIKPVKYVDYRSVYGPLPGSLEGAPLPTGLSVDSDGQLIPTAALQRLFDYFLTTVGEEPLDRVVERIREYLDVQLDEPALSQANQVLDTYLAMKEAIIAMEAEWSEQVAQGGPRPNFQDIFDRKKALRLELLGEEVYEAFYQRDEQMDEYTLRKLTILKDEELTQEEKNQQLAEIENVLPEDLQQKKEEERALEQLEDDIRVAQAQGASDTEIYQMRLEVMGAEKANRFQRADLAKRGWDTRVTEYRNERNQILNSTLSDEDKQSQIEALRESHFSGRELMRIPVIDRMKDQQETLN